MVKYDPTFEDIICARMSMTGNTIASLAARTKIPVRTMYRRMEDGNWSRNQLMLLHKYLGFSSSEIATMLGKELRND